MQKLFNPIADPNNVVIEFYFTRVYDHNRLKAINWLDDKYRDAGFFGKTGQ